MGTAPRAPDVVDGPHVSATCCLRRIHFTDSPFTLSSASTMTVTASTLPEPQFKHYDRDLIRDDLEQRVTFARDFLRFTEDDGKLLNSVAPLISPLIKPTVDGVYTQLFRFDVTSRPFLKKNADYEGNEHAVDLSQLNHDDPQISHRKKILSAYVGKAVLSLPDETADISTKTSVITAFNKLIWVQNDLFNKYYSKTDEELAAATAARKEEDTSA